MNDCTESNPCPFCRANAMANLLHAIAREIDAIEPASCDAAIRALAALAARDPDLAVPAADAMGVIALTRGLHQRIVAARPLIERAAAGLDGAPDELRGAYPNCHN